MSPPWNPGVTVAHDADGWIAIHKPTGLQAHPNRNSATERANSILDAGWDPESEAYELSDGSRIWLCHRIDAPTSGLLLLARDSDLAQRARDAFACGIVMKTYHAIVIGAVRLESTVWRDHLLRDSSAKGVRMRIAFPHGLTAITEVQSLKSTRRPHPLTLLEMQPRTGRTHQLRVQAASRRLPILGDRTYGDFRQNRDLFSRTTIPDRLYLHASSLHLADPQYRLPRLHCPPPMDWPLCPGAPT